MRPIPRKIRLALALFLMAAGAALGFLVMLYAYTVKWWMLVGLGLVFAVGVIWLYSESSIAPLDEERDNAPRS